MELGFLSASEDEAATFCAGLSVSSSKPPEQAYQ